MNNTFVFRECSFISSFSSLKKIVGAVLFGRPFSLMNQSRGGCLSAALSAQARRMEVEALEKVGFFI